MKISVRVTFEDGALIRLEALRWRAAKLWWWRKYRVSLN